MVAALAERSAALWYQQKVVMAGGSFRDQSERKHFTRNCAEGRGTLGKIGTGALVHPGDHSQGWDGW